MSKLFAVLLGGRAERCNTELHDIVFAVGNSLEDTYPQLIKQWFGLPHRLHVDSFIEVKFVDGYEVIINQTSPEPNDKKLFLVNYGGYKPGYFGEIHDVKFYVADSKEDVAVRAKQELGSKYIQPHIDDNLAVDDILAVENLSDYYVHLLPTQQKPEIKIETRYIKLAPKI